MKIPKYIIKAISDSDKYSKLYQKNDAVIRKWLKENNMFNDMNIDQLIDSITFLHQPEKFIEHLNSDDVEFGNSADYE